MKNIISRKLDLKFPSDIPKHWLGGSIFKTHLLNSFTMVFPTGEKYFIRSINQYFKHIEDPKLREEVKAFIRQETQHASEHEKFFANLNEQGYDIDKLVQAIDFVVKKILEPAMGSKLNLATTAGLEHFTALLAEIGLKEQFLADAHPVMKQLFEWHAAEEIEHRNVAYDVLQEIDDSYLLRVAGLINAYFMLFGFSGICILYLVLKDRKLLGTEVLFDAFETYLSKEGLFFKSLFICARYLGPGFHPSRNQVEHLADAILNAFDLRSPQSV